MQTLAQFLASKPDSLISVVNSPHLSWKNDSETGEVIPAYSERKNRQQLPPSYLETGAFLISSRKAITNNSRLGSCTRVFQVPASESTDIDTRQDWIVCEAMLSRRSIAYRADGYKERGLGHIFRGLTLGYELIEHDVVFICDRAYPLGIEKLKKSNVRVVVVDGESDLISWLDRNRIDIFVNDCLDTEKEYVQAIKKRVGRFVP